MFFSNFAMQSSPIKSYIGSIFQILSILFIFIFVIFLAYISTKLIASNKMKNMKSSNMQIIESVNLGFNSLHILKINEKFYLISSSKEGIRYLTELDKENISLENFQNTISFDENLKLYLKKAKDKIGGKNEK